MGVTFFGGPPFIHGHTSSFIYPNLPGKNLQGRTNELSSSTIRASLSFKKVQGFTISPSTSHAWSHLEASIINSGPAPCTWRPVSNGTISNNGTAKEPCRYSMAHGENNMGIWKCFRFFWRGKCPQDQSLQIN